MGNVPNIRKVRSEIAKGSETLIYTEILYIEDCVCQIEIVSDAHPSASHAGAKVWSEPDRLWSHVTSSHYSLMGTKYSRVTVASEADFREDRDDLVTRLLEILFPDLNSPSQSGCLTSSPN